MKMRTLMRISVLVPIIASVSKFLWWYDEKTPKAVMKLKN